MRVSVVTSYEKERRFMDMTSVVMFNLTMLRRNHALTYVGARKVCA